METLPRWHPLTRPRDLTDDELLSERLRVTLLLDALNAEAERRRER